MNLLCLSLLLAVAASAHAQPLHVIWDRSGAGDSSRYGYAILPLGDQDNDGFKDWAVLAGGGHGSPSVLEFFHGGNVPSTVPYSTLQRPFGPQPSQAVGDVNGDGYIDWLTRTYIDEPFPPDTSLVSLYFGGPQADTLADWSLLSPWDDFLGTVGDFNGDGFSDLYWYHYHADYTDIFYGGDPPDTLPDWTKHSVPHGSGQAFPGSYGHLTSTMNSDFVGPTWNTTFIFHGGANPDTVPADTLPYVPYNLLGVVNDLNGDGYDELVFGGPEEAEVFWGGPTLHAMQDFTLDFSCSTPTRAASAGDFNHDGYRDLLLLTDNCIVEWGVVSLYLGHPWVNPQPSFSLFGGDPPWNLISIQTAAGLGDVNGDGVDDIAVGAYEFITRGRVLVFAGDSTRHVGAPDRPLSPYPSSLSLSAFPNPFNPTTTLSLSLPREAEVTITLFDITGRRIETLLHTRLSAGTHTIPFDGHSLPSGLYFARVQSSTQTRTQKLLLLK